MLYLTNLNMIMKLYRATLIYVISLTTLPFLILLTNIDFSIYQTSEKVFWLNTWLTLGNTVGFIGGILLFWQFILGTRYIVKLFSKDLNWVNKLHQWLGKYGVVIIFSHPLFIMFYYFENIQWIFIPNISTDNELHITYGRIAFIILLTIYFTSALIRGRIRYRPWLYLHYLVYVLLGFVLIHALDLGTFIARYLVLKVIWWGMIVLFIYLVIIRLLVFSGILTKKFKLIKKEMAGGDIAMLTFQTDKAINVKVGQYFYVQIHAFGEAHPFTALEYNLGNKTITFGIKSFGKYTKKMTALEIGKIVNIDGPYGVFTLEGQNNLPKVILAGGIGITPFIELAKQYGDENTLFFYSNRHIKEAVSRENLMKIVGMKYYDFLSEGTESGENIIQGHLDKDSLEQIIGKDKLNNHQYFVCGSKRYNEGIITLLKECGISKNKIFYENFY